MNLNNIEYNQILHLYNLCKSSNNNDVDFISTIYNESYSYFNETLTFCKNINLLIQKEKKLLYVKSDKSFKELLIQKLIEHRHSLGSLSDFLSNFSLDNENYTYNISNQERILYKWERYFLDEIGLITYNKNTIIFRTNYSDLLPNKRLTLKELKRINSLKEKYGELAEQFVYNYEINTLKKYLSLPQNCIKQISKHYVNAGYDIESFDKEEAKNNIYKKIFIEVKCVNEDQVFYWSKNEISKAEGLKSKYFLYLVSQINNNPKINIIQDPFENILKNKNWSCETELLRIKRSNHEKK